MVKLFHIAVLYKYQSKVTLMTAASDLSSIGFFQRSSAAEFMKFTSSVVVERMQLTTRTTIKEGEYMCHCYLRCDGLSGVLISDHEYPNRVAHTFINKVLDDFAAKYPPDSWSSGSSFPLPGLEAQLAKFQTPNQADAMLRIQADLDETKIILHNTIEAVLERGEKLDDLVAKSDDLSSQSKMFYKTARKTNQCCVLL
ncbi:synaptobrevin homolog YKT6-like [Varroa jacobsoni]|uniref:synaptobrevin homolog YKT6-like n=1 Tax=Varroa jacobsoni TaxID=62625 RepID=UPI000BF3C288|nr:synaptobrevin homolog YKT6-like [Varroa jacobsoni]XP_022703039.1 synaptobrevin homolog YKT6-like [Varroa jacobsoni]XP_022703040.1 synaptobrevin homolog YKT6-like [Varroa jacobsoni]